MFCPHCNYILSLLLSNPFPCPGFLQKLSSFRECCPPIFLMVVSASAKQDGKNVGGEVKDSVMRGEKEIITCEN